MQKPPDVFSLRLLTRKLIFSFPFFLAAYTGSIASRPDQDAHVVMRYKTAVNPPAEILAENNSGMPVLPGSAIKPFAAYYLAGKDQFLYSERLYCPGKKTSGVCYRNPGHQWVNLYSALNVSCNHYFYEQAMAYGYTDFFDFLNERFGFNLHQYSARPENLYGGLWPDPLPLKQLGYKYAALLKVIAFNHPEVLAGLHKELHENYFMSTLYQANNIYNESSASLRYKFIWGKTGTETEGFYRGGLAILFFLDNENSDILIFTVYQKKMTGSQVAVSAIEKLVPDFLEKYTNE